MPWGQAPWVGSACYLGLCFRPEAGPLFMLFCLPGMLILQASSDRWDRYRFFKASVRWLLPVALLPSFTPAWVRCSFLWESMVLCSFLPESADHSVVPFLFYQLPLPDWEPTECPQPLCAALNGLSHTEICAGEN